MIASSSQFDRPSRYSLKGIVRGLKLHWLLAASLFVGILVTGVVVVLVAPRSYVSEAKLFVRVGKESIGLDPTATTGQTISVFESRESEIGSVLDLLQSRAVLEAAVDRLGPEYILTGDESEVPTGQPPQPELPAVSTDPKKDVSEKPVEAPLGDGRFASGLTTKPVRGSADERLREQAVQQLRGGVKVTHPKKSSVLTVTCKAGSPQKAQRIVQAVLDAFLERHLRANRTAGSREFFDQQVRLLKPQLDEALNQLATAKNKAGLVSIDGERKLLEDQMGEIRRFLYQSRAELAAGEATCRALQQEADQLPERLVAQETIGLPQSATDRTRQQLFELQIRERELLARFTERHPLVVALREQITRAERILQLEDQEGRGQSMKAANPARQQVDLNLLTERARVASLRAKAESLESSALSLGRRLEDLNRHEGTLATAKQRVELLQTSFKSYSEKLEQARVDDALETQQISNVNVVQAPTHVAKPAGPKVRLILSLAMFVGVLAGVGASWLREYGWPTLLPERELGSGGRRGMVQASPPLARSKSAGTMVPNLENVG